MHKKKIYHRLTGVACFLIEVLAIIFSLFLMPIGGSRAQTPTVATFLGRGQFTINAKNLAAGTNVSSSTPDNFIEQIVRKGIVPVGVTTGLLSTYDSELPIIAWYDSGTLYYYTEADIIYLNQDSSRMFDTMRSLVYIDTSGWNTSRVTTMYSMFWDCSNLTKLDTSSWDTSNVTNMVNMFAGCSSLTGLDVSNWDTSNVTGMQNMFAGCSSLTEIDVSKWDTSNVISMDVMFQGCQSLTGLDVSGWDTSNVTGMQNMFMGCSSLTSLDTSSWNTSNVTDMVNMFLSCSIRAYPIDGYHFDMWEGEVD